MDREGLPSGRRNEGHVSNFQDSLRKTLTHYRYLFQAARRRGDVGDARECGIMVARLSLDLSKIPSAKPDTDEQDEDHLIGWVRMRQLEFAEVERLLTDDRALGVMLLARLVGEMGERFEMAMTWENEKESKAS
jgi:hypothetical protein